MKISKEVQEELIQIEREACTDSFYENLFYWVIVCNASSLWQDSELFGVSRENEEQAI